MPRFASTAAKHFRTYVSIPGVLEETVRQRWEEFRYPGFSPFALELICYDLRKRRSHDISLLFSQDTPEAQDAIDRELRRQYRRGAERRDLLAQAEFCNFAAAAGQEQRCTFSRFRNHVRYSGTLAPCIDIRWRELGYANFSEYVTGLIRYDLMLLGPHLCFNGDDTDPVLLDALDRGTRREFEENKPKRLYADYLLEKAAGRRLSEEEIKTEMRNIAAVRREMALRALNRRPKTDSNAAH